MNPALPFTSGARRCLILSSFFVLLTGCDQGQHFQFALKEPPADWHHVTDYHPCYLKIDRQWRSSLRVNCFQINGELYTHSSRLVPAHESLTNLFGLGGSWVSVVERNPRIQLAIDLAAHEMVLIRVEDKTERDRILADRDYDPIPESIQVYLMKPG